METLSDQFDKALGRINLGEKVKRAKAAHEQVRDVLAADPVLQSYDVETILIGSYGRDVAIWPGHDVDVFVKLPGYDEDPASMYEAVREPLKNRYKDRLDDTGAHALSIAFGDDFSVDVVAATTSPSTAHWILPSLDSMGNRTQWEETDPERLGALTEERNKTPLIGTQGAYKPVVKLVRQIRKHHAGDARPKGLYIEMVTYWAFQSGVSGGAFAEILASALDRIATQLESGVIAVDPALERPFAPAPTDEELTAAAKVFREQASAAAKALTLDKCPAAAAWRKILGRNGNGWVFPLPEGCDEHGNTVKTVEPVTALGSNEARGFASA